MVAPERLTNPPITEALVDIRVAANKTIAREHFKAICDEIRADYPHIDERRDFEAELKIEAGQLIPPSARDLGFRGLWLKSPDGNKVVQFRNDGFTLNVLNVYPGGAALIEEALSLWTRFVRASSPVSATRVAMRYINRLELAYEPGDNLRRFLVAPGDLPTGCPQQVSGFLTRVTARDDQGFTVVVTQKLDIGPKSPVPLIVDIDAFCNAETPVECDKLRTVLDSLRAIKNRCFFSLLTKEALEPYT